MTRFPSSVAANESVAGRLLKFNRHMLEQALDVVNAHESPTAPAYGHLAGPHVRHVIEHYEALLAASVTPMVDYDLRPRDRDVEQFPHVARQRLEALFERLDAMSATAGASEDAEGELVRRLQQPLRVRGLAGLVGEFEFITESTMGRELAFLASHTVHHFALLRSYCTQHGMAMAETFGVAPATIAHARQNAAPPRVVLHEDTRSAPRAASFMQSAA